MLKCGDITDVGVITAYINKEGDIRTTHSVLEDAESGVQKLQNRYSGHISAAQ